MALVQETVTVDGAQFLHTFSDDEHYILQEDTGIQYIEAFDPIDNPLNHSYVEDDELIPSGDDEETDPFAEAGRILLGVNEDDE